MPKCRYPCLLCVTLGMQSWTAPFHRIWGENAELKILSRTDSWSLHDLAILELMAAITCYLVANQKHFKLYTCWVHIIDFISSKTCSTLLSLPFCFFLISGILAAGFTHQYSFCLGKSVLFSSTFCRDCLRVFHYRLKRDFCNGRPACQGCANWGLDA